MIKKKERTRSTSNAGVVRTTLRQATRLSAAVTAADQVAVDVVRLISVYSGWPSELIQDKFPLGGAPLQFDKLGLITLAGALNPYVRQRSKVGRIAPRDLKSDMSVEKLIKLVKEEIARTA